MWEGDGRAAKGRQRAAMGARTSFGRRGTDERRKHRLDLAVPIGRGEPARVDVAGAAAFIGGVPDIGACTPLPEDVPASPAAPSAPRARPARVRLVVLAVFLPVLLLTSAFVP